MAWMILLDSPEYFPRPKKISAPSKLFDGPFLDFSIQAIPLIGASEK
jgi:hypothetical protein